MLRVLKTRIPVYMSVWPVLFGKNTNDEPDEKLFSKYRNEEETGMDRVKQMFSLNHANEPSREIVQIIQGTTLAGIVGLFIGGFTASKHSADNFRKDNMATQFNNAREAKRQMQSKVIGDYGKGAWKYSVKLSVFCFVFMGVSTTISVYRGESSVWEYLIAGIATGSILKLWSGPRAMLVGAGLGASLGVMGGLITLVLLRATGSTMEEIRIWQYDWRKWRQDQFHDVIKKHKQEEEKKEWDELMKKFDMEQKKT